MNWEYLREEEFDGAIERSKGVCVIPLGCLEKHGQHLPSGTDSLKAKRLAEDAAAIEEVTVFPTGMWLGDVCGFHSNPTPETRRERGGIGLNPHTIMTVLEELCDEISRNGFKKILILNSHGGNTDLLGYFTRGLYYKQRDYAVAWTNCTDAKRINPENMYGVVMERIEDFPYLTEEDLAAMKKFSETGAGGGHADWRETAVMMHYYPDTVAPDRFDAESGLSTHLGDGLRDAELKSGLIYTMNYPNHFAGYAPFGCSANIGRAMAQLSVERLVRIFKVLKDDKLLLKRATDRRFFRLDE